MVEEKLPERVPDGMTRYKAFTSRTGNPFKGKRLDVLLQVVDVDSEVSFGQVESWEEEAAKEAGLFFLRLGQLKQFL